MPPCGNFGLVFLNAESSTANDLKSPKQPINVQLKSQQQSIQIYPTDFDNESDITEAAEIKLLPVLKILQSQAACTEIRGGKLVFFI